MAVKIAFASDDGVSISAHFGQALKFVFVTKDGETITREEAAKPTHQHGTAHGADHTRMFAMVQGCEAVIARGMGQGAYNNISSVGAKPIITTTKDIATAIDEYFSGSLPDHPERMHH